MEIDPRTPHGTKVLSYNMYLNITKGSPYLENDGNYTVNLGFGCCTRLAHNEDLLSNEFYYNFNFYNHYYRTLLGVKLPGMNVSASINLMGPFEALFPLSNAEIQQCHWRGSTFIKVPVGIYLLSPYIYHLGIMYVRISGVIRDEDYYIKGRFEADSYIIANAGKKLL